jgi:hypothetical protein
MISMTPRKHVPLSLTLLTPAVAIFLTSVAIHFRQRKPE